MFSDEELPETMKDVLAFQQNSPNQYTHLHLALITHDINSVKRLLDTGMTNLNAQDVYGRTPLDIAIANGFVDAALMILDYSPRSVVSINANWFSNAFEMGHSRGFQSLLSHPKLQVNVTQVAAAAMQNHCLDIVNYLLSEHKIKPNSFIQGALLTNDLPLIELLTKYGANPDFQDNLGNTALHYAAYLLNEKVCLHLLTNTTDSFLKKNKQGHHIMDILFQTAEKSLKTQQNPEKELSIMRMIIKTLDFNENNKDQQDLVISILDFAINHNATELFQLALQKANNNPKIINKFSSKNGIKLTFLHQAILKNNKDFINMLLDAGANTNLVIRNNTASLSTNPLIGKSAHDLMTNNNEHIQLKNG